MQTVLKEQELFSRLLSGGKTAVRAWEDFLESYSNLFLKIIWETEKDRDTVMERYLHVCSKFAEKDFAILRKFKQKHGENPPKFTSWLGAVVRNMIVDSYRSTEGRRRIPKALQGLHRLDRKVFELYYWRGFGPEEIDQELAAGRNGSRESISDILERLGAKLLRPPVNPALEPMTIRLSYNDEAPVLDPAPFLDQETIDRWLSSLPTDERLSIQLKFWDDLSVGEIGEILKASSEKRVIELLENALKKLRAVAKEERYS